MNSEIPPILLAIAITALGEASTMAQSGISLFAEGNLTMLKIEGNARVETAALLKLRLTQTQIERDMAIDWGEAEHVDACVLQVLLALHRALAAEGLSLTVKKDNLKVRQYLHLSGLSEYFPVRRDPRSSEPTEGENG
jgi:anti-anti-sigma regulatory factor